MNMRKVISVLMNYPTEELQAHADELRQYLMDHSSAVAGEGLGGTLRYARFAAHTADYRPEPGAQR